MRTRRSFGRMPLLTSLLRLLFPSWAFFNVASAPPSLEVRATTPPDASGPWLAVVRAPRRRWWHLFFNARGTQALARQTVVERWQAEHDAGEDESVSWALLQNMAEQEIPGDREVRC